MIWSMTEWNGLYNTTRAELNLQTSIPERKTCTAAQGAHCLQVPYMWQIKPELRYSHTCYSYKLYTIYGEGEENGKICYKFFTRSTFSCQICLMFQYSSIHECLKGVITNKDNLLYKRQENKSKPQKGKKTNLGHIDRVRLKPYLKLQVNKFSF